MKPTPAVHQQAELQTFRQGGKHGAEIRAPTLGRPLSDARFQAIHAALVAQEVIYFRDQDLPLQARRDRARPRRRRPAAHRVLGRRHPASVR